MNSVKNYWLHNAALWENARYSLATIWDPRSWALRERKRVAQRILNDLIQNKEVSSLLDLGSGSGHILDGLHLGASNTYTGLELNPQLVLEGQKRWAQNNRIKLLCGDAFLKDLPAADIVIASGFWDWLSDQERREIFNRHKPNFFLVSCTEMRPGLVSRIYSKYHQNSPKDQDRRFPRLEELASFERAFQESGYEILKMERCFWAKMAVIYLFKRKL
jgi:SAM-dependent methyltransferase